MFDPMVKANVAGAVVVLGGCAAAHIDPDDRDTTGAYNGVWIGSVGAPRAKRESLPGNWIMRCDWQPFEVTFRVIDGRIRFDDIEGKTPVSSEGAFRLDLSGGQAGMTGGTMSGNGRYVQSFSGTLAGDDPGGRYLQFVTSRGKGGCNAPLRLRRAGRGA